MTDVLTHEQRRRCMSRIRGKDTRPEKHLRQALWSTGLRYRIRNRLIGRPDIVFPSSRVAVFVDGCFWHRCPEHGVSPVTNSLFWERKLDRNVARDREVTARLADEGWIVIRLWEHEVKHNVDACVARIRAAVRSGNR